jgi:hypothetical protein
MRRTTSRRALLAAGPAGATALALPQLARAVSPREAGWTSLFDGQSLAGWTRMLAREKDEVDPTHVFGVTTMGGGPILRVSGERIGGLTSTAVLEDYHLQLEFKWGDGRFGPRAKEPRDSGLLYHGAGLPAVDTGWLESLELGMLEGGETGDFWSVPGRRSQAIRVNVEGEPIPAAQRRYGDQDLRWKRGGALHVQRKAAIAISADHERPRGAWNVLDLYCVGQAAVHVTNGKVNLAMFDLRRAEQPPEAPPDSRFPGHPVTRGQIQLQSEWAETFFRRLRWRPISALPPFAAAALPPEALPNVVSAADRKQGWRPLFDGRTLRGLRGVESVTVPANWRVEGTRLRDTGPGGDLATVEAFEDFELGFEWRLDKGANGGVFYGVDLARRPLHRHAPEYELRDNADWTDSPWKAGSLYGLAIGPSPVYPAGTWNTSRILARGDRVLHLLNGTTTASYDRSAAGLAPLLAKGPFQGAEGFGATRRGAIVFQNHGGGVELRNVRVRRPR